MSRRPPARRGSSRRWQPARRKGPDGFAVGAVVLFAVVAVVGVVRWLVEHWVILALVAVVGAGAVAVWVHQVRDRGQWEQVRAQGLRLQLSHLDALHYDKFEYAIRDLMRRDGCRDARKMGGRGDNGCDVMATDPLGRRWVIQCKHRRRGLAGSAVGTPDLQVLNGTARQVHQADVAVIVTNGRFSAPALTFGRQQRLHLVDRQLLALWAAGSRPLWELLDRIPPPRRPTPLS